MELEDLAEDIPQNSCNFPVSIPEPKYICKSCKGRSRYNDETIKVSRSGGADSDGNQPGDLLSLSYAQILPLTGDVVLKVHSGTQLGQKVVLKKKGSRQGTLIHLVIKMCTSMSTFHL
nr:chaperone protein dnaj gfa2, mitochondrial [Quercus suber]